MIPWVENHRQPDIRVLGHDFQGQIPGQTTDIALEAIAFGDIDVFYFDEEIFILYHPFWNWMVILDSRVIPIVWP